jgi:hypothetical protein
MGKRSCVYVLSQCGSHKSLTARFQPTPRLAEIAGRTHGSFRFDVEILISGMTTKCLITVQITSNIRLIAAIVKDPIIASPTRVSDINAIYTAPLPYVKFESFPDVAE